MSPWSAKVVWFLAVLAGLFFGYGAYWYRLRAHENTAPLVVDRNRLDFGTVWCQEHFLWPIKVTNISASDIDIDDFVLSCRCTAVTPKTLHIPAGKERDILLELDLTSGLTGSIDGHSRRFTIEVMPQVRSHLPNTITWAISGMVRDAIRIDTPTIDYGQSLIAGMPFPSKSIQLSATLDLADLSVEAVPVGPQGPSASATVHRIGPRIFDLRAAPSANHSLGPFRCQLLLTPSLPNQVLPPVPVTLTGTIVNDLHAVPPRVHFGYLRIGCEAHEVIVIQSRSGSQFTLTGNTVSGTVRVASVSEFCGRGQAFRVSQMASSPGHHVSHLEFRSSNQIVIVPVGYEGYD